jgi:HSP20 family molecular chaperone IbpA
MSTNEHRTISDDTIRRQYDENTKQWYFSVIDIIAIVSETSDARNYWKVLKSRLQKANPQLVTACNQLKLPSSDGKNYLTDVANSETLLEIITTISLPQVAPFRLWFEKIESGTYQQNSFPQFESSAEVAELPIDMYQRNGALIIQTLVAGTNPEDIIIRATYENIFISGSRKAPAEFSKENSVTQELFYGPFSRSIDLAVPVELDRVEATISHGFITITIPLIDTKRTRIIKIKAQ